MYGLFLFSLLDPSPFWHTVYRQKQAFDVAAVHPEVSQTFSLWLCHVCVPYSRYNMCALCRNTARSCHVAFTEMQIGLRSLINLRPLNFLCRHRRRHNHIRINFGVGHASVVGWSLKAVDTRPIGNCQRLAFTVGVSQHMHEITNLWKFELNRSSNLRENNERKNTFVTRSCCVHLDGWFRDLKF